MPPQPAKAKQVNTAPSQSLLDRLLGNSPMTPEMLQGIEIAKREIPNLGPIDTYGPISRFVAGEQSQGYASPGRTIYLNPIGLQGKSPQDVADTITHENTHVQQMRERGTNAFTEFFRNMGQNKGELYHRRPDEMEAFQAEQARRARMGRIQTAMPKFLPQETIDYSPQNIILPSSNRR